MYFIVNFFVFFFCIQCLDPRFPSDHKVTLYFGNNTPNGDGRGYIFQSPLVKIEPVTTLAKYDSLEDFDDGKYCFFFVGYKYYYNSP